MTVKIKEMNDLFIMDSALSGKSLIGEPLDISSLYPLYQELLKSFSSMGIELLPPKLLPYCSFNKRIEVKYLETSFKMDRSSFLLFDTHLLDIFGEFTEAFLDDKNAAFLTRRLTYRLLAEALYTRSKLHSTLHFAYCHRVAQGSIRFSKERNKKMARFLLIQEAFMLCHEISHWCLFRCNEEEKQRQLVFKRSLWTQYLDDLIESRKRKADSNGIVMLGQMRDKILTDDKTVEECVCDTFAAIFLMEYFGGINDYTKTDIAIGSFLAVQNLQLLVYLEDDTNAATNKNSSTELSLQMTLRMVIYKHHLHNYLNSNSKLDVEEYDREIITCKERYDERIYTEFISTLDGAQREIERLDSLPEITFLDEFWEGANLLARSLLMDE